MGNKNNPPVSKAMAVLIGFVASVAVMVTVIANVRYFAGGDWREVCEVGWRLIGMGVLLFGIMFVIQKGK